MEGGREGDKEGGRKEEGREGGWVGRREIESMSNKKEGREAQQAWKEDTTSVRTLNMYTLQYLSLLVHMCTGLNQNTDHIDMAFL